MPFYLYCFIVKKHYSTASRYLRYYIYVMLHLQVFLHCSILRRYLRYYIYVMLHLQVFLHCSILRRYLRYYIYVMLHLQVFLHCSILRRYLHYYIYVMLLTLPIDFNYPKTISCFSYLIYQKSSNCFYLIADLDRDLSAS